MLEKGPNGIEKKIVIMKLQYCAKVMRMNFVEMPGFSELFKEISLQAIFP